MSPTTTQGRHVCDCDDPAAHATLDLDDPASVERLARALTGTMIHSDDWPYEFDRQASAAAIIAALRKQPGPGFYDDPNAEGNDR